MSDTNTLDPYGPVFIRTPDPLGVRQLVPSSFNLTFVNNGLTVVRLVIKDDQLVFDGQLDPSAQVLFDALRPMVDGYIQTKLAQGSQLPSE